MHPNIKDELRLELPCFLRDAAALLEASAEMTTTSVRDDALKSVEDLLYCTVNRVSFNRTVLRSPPAK